MYYKLIRMRIIEHLGLYFDVNYVRHHGDIFVQSEEFSTELSCQSEYVLHPPLLNQLGNKGGPDLDQFHFKFK